MLAQTQSLPDLHIVIVEGDRAENSIPLGSAADIVVRVQDEFGQPLSGATVTVQYPQYGPGALFRGGNSLASLTTDTRGLVRFSGMEPNSAQGEFQVEVSAAHQSRVARMTITQTNVMAHVRTLGSSDDYPRAGGSRKWWIALAIAGGAGAAAALAMAARGGGNGGDAPASSPGTPAQLGGITITPGPPTVTGP